MTKRISFTVLFLFLITPFIYSQQIDDEKLKKKMNTEEIIWDNNNGDGVFIAKFK